MNYEMKKYILYGIGRIRALLAWIKLHDGRNIVLGRHIQINGNSTKRKLYKMYFILLRNNIFVKIILDERSSELTFLCVSEYLTKNKSEKKNNIKTHSERSNECIDFTMIITSRNNAPISNFGGGFRSKSEYPWCIIEFSKKSRKTKKKNDGKTGIFTQNQFSTKSIFLYSCNSKTNHCKHLKFSLNVYFLINYSYIQILTKIRQTMNICKLFCRPLNINHHFHQPLKIIS
ncbi:Uncharacterized protein FWK35_00015596 [Aphis craccivora]|uniref:Uncharacterized protein n=1 Tax=Aphis craccivora TaxID=307492 RepID=A0A6G0YQQ1_APHCR|nr:Uncharacterized protein FWK35_00015596 [Aphis craccivora]